MKGRALASILVFLAAAGATGAAAEIFRCRAGAGAVTYQEIPCSEGDGGAVNIPTSYPEANYAERDRLLRREAELDARLLRRAEIDAQVQIAREERYAREREAEMRAQATAAADAPLYIVPYAFSRSFPHPRVFRSAPRPQPRWF